MSKQSVKEQSKSPTVGIGSDDDMESSKLSTSNQSSNTISMLGKTSNVDVEFSKISRISLHSTSKQLSKGLEQEFDLIHSKEQNQVIAPLTLHQLRLERNISPPNLGIGYHKYLICAIWTISILTGKNYQESMSDLDTAFLQYSFKFNEDNKCNSVKAQKLKEKKIRCLRDIRKAFYHYNVLVFWLKKNKYSVELENPTNYGKNY